MSDAQGEHREEDLQERKLLIDWEHSSSTSFDKAMLTLSAGALALSLTYLKEIGASGAWVWPLPTCWILFALALLFTTWSFLFSQHALRRQREILNDGKVSTNGSGNKGAVKNRWGCATNCLNWLSIISFTLGVVFLAMYAVSGLQGVDQ